MNPERVRRLEAIHSWSTESSFDALFRTQRDRFRAAIMNTDSAMDTREATVWANNLRTTRQRLIAQGTDLPEWKLDAVAAIPGWSWNPHEEGFLAKIVILQDFAAEERRTIGSVKQRDEWRGHKIGMWVASFRSRRDTYDPERRTVLEELPGWAWTPQEDAWNNTLAELSEWAVKNSLMPKANASDPTERRLGVWKRNNKSKRQGRTDDYQAVNLRMLLAEYGEDML